MIVVDFPTLFHPICLSCKRSDEARGPYIDFNRDYDLDHQGRMYECRTCIKTAAKELGLLSGDENELREENERLARELSDARQELEAMREFERNAEWTLEHFGQKVQKKPGRKPKKEIVNA